MTRIIINGISFYTTWKRVKEGTVSDHTSINTAVSAAYKQMYGGYYSVATTVTVYDHNMKRIEYNVQIDRG